ncbi:Protein CBG20207 [Caenorhabditis briggsae]|uniref:Protein CBG20207 n=2 Tax=Caenorhabditis briggsae TaxID=6238 RepID=A8XX70_CAEBR|nr:Protein CBG20207 [Caenorhabditis briggsae]ULU02622.1 hypothetical protein L3Y34_002302 [Caenorhabditis briggsae]CAP37239.1 Protein CBG20207 [Caenorhabditis briggsae]
MPCTLFQEPEAPPEPVKEETMSVFINSSILELLNETDDNRPVLRTLEKLLERGPEEDRESSADELKGLKDVEKFVKKFGRRNMEKEHSLGVNIRVNVKIIVITVAVFVLFGPSIEPKLPLCAKPEDKDCIGKVQMAFELALSGPILLLMHLVMKAKSKRVMAEIRHQRFIWEGINNLKNRMKDDCGHKIMLSEITRRQMDAVKTMHDYLEPMKLKVKVMANRFNLTEMFLHHIFFAYLFTRLIVSGKTILSGVYIPLEVTNIVCFFYMLKKSWETYFVVMDQLFEYTGYDEWIDEKLDFFFF